MRSENSTEIRPCLAFVKGAPTTRLQVFIHQGWELWLNLRAAYRLTKVIKKKKKKNGGEMGGGGGGVKGEKKLHELENLKCSLVNLQRR